MWRAKTAVPSAVWPWQVKLQLVRVKLEPAGHGRPCTRPSATVGGDARAATLPRRSDGERCAPPGLGWPRARRRGGVQRERLGAGRRRGRDPRRHARRSRALRCVHRSAGRGFRPLRASASCPSSGCVPPSSVAHARHRQLGAQRLRIPGANVHKPCASPVEANTGVGRVGTLRRAPGRPRTLLPDSGRWAGARSQLSS
jgi:hypothetical protein